MDENYEGKLQRYYGCNKAIKTHIKDKKKFSNEIKNGDRKEKKNWKKIMNKASISK